MHPETAATLHDLAMFEERQGNLQEALALYHRAFTLREQVLGQDHPKTEATRQRLTALEHLLDQESGTSLPDDPLPDASDPPLEHLP